MTYRHPHARAIPLSEAVEIWLLVVSILAAVVLLRVDFIPALVALSGDTFISSFIAGIFFTSVLTTAPAIIALGEIGVHASAWHVAFAGGLGALVGDLLIFRFVRSRLVEHIMRISFSPRARRMGKVLSKGPFRWIPVLLGTILIASPLPDEIGLVMLGISHIRLWQFLPIALFANMAGIYGIAMVAQHLAS